MPEKGFLAEVLAIKEESLIGDIKQKIPVLTSQIEKLKYDVKTFTEGENSVESPLNTKNKLLQQANNLNNDMDQLNETIQEVTKHHIDKSVLDIENLNEDLQETKLCLKIVTQLININEALKKIKQLEQEKKYLEATKHVLTARKIIEVLIEERLDIIDVVASNLTIRRDSLAFMLTNLWQEAVIIENSEEENITNVAIKIDNSSFDLKEIIEALYYDKNTSKFDQFADCLLNGILTPVINNTVQIKIYQENNFEILNIKIKDNSPKMEYRSVFDNLSTVFDFFCCKIDYTLEPNLNFLGYMGKKIRKQFCDIFIKNCLSDTVPSTQKELENYKKVVEEIESLHASLLECGFFNKECNQILEYAGNIDELFANKVCKNYCARATLIFKKDLHDMIEIGVDPNQSPENQKINSFPKCYVSRSSCEVINLIRTIMDQAVISSDICASRLLCTSKQIMEDYCKSVPEYHKKLLENIPQQVALFHNNCMFLSHELITYEKYYTTDIKNNAFEGQTFDFQIQYLKTAGQEAFLKYMRSQIKQIEDILNESELAMLGHIEKLDPNCEKSIRQCLRQLEILKTVWQKVLTYEIYNKNIGELLNSFINHLIQVVLAVEDISADTSTLLVEMFKIIENRGPKLFTDPKEIIIYTKHWYKFTEIILLLNSSLTDINDRWADGKGPLAVAYSPEEIRKLIRALFQNTDRRAAVLSQIY